VPTSSRVPLLDPFLATYAGIAGHDEEMPDLSVDGFAARAELDRSTLACLEAAVAPGLREQVGRAAMEERLGLAVKCYDAGDTTSQLNVMASWIQYVREVFDAMPTEGEQAADALKLDPGTRRSSKSLGQFLAGRAGAKKSVSNWLTRSCSSWCTQCEASGRRSTRSRLGTSSCSGSASSGPR
jgi:Bacterial protein of unknown function (DUF885)